MWVEARFECYQLVMVCDQKRFKRQYNSNCFDYIQNEKYHLVTCDTN